MTWENSGFVQLSLRSWCTLLFSCVNVTHLKQKQLLSGVLFFFLKRWYTLQQWFSMGRGRNFASRNIGQCLETFLVVPNWGYGTIPTANLGWHLVGWVLRCCVMYNAQDIRRIIQPQTLPYIFTSWTFVNKIRGLNLIWILKKRVVFLFNIKKP